MNSRPPRNGRAAAVSFERQIDVDSLVSERPGPLIEGADNQRTQLQNIRDGVVVAPSRAS